MTAPIPTVPLDNGVALPALGLGVLRSPPAETAAAVESALAAGCAVFHDFDGPGHLTEAPK